MEHTVKKRDWTPLIGCLIIFVVYLFIHDLGRQPIWDSSPWDSYSMQAMRWREGHMDLAEDYSWLEIATYEGRYYLSFPPVPTIPMWLLSFFTGGQNPTNLVMKFYVMGAFLLLYRIFRKKRFSSYASLFWGLFITLGCNLASVGVYGGVWFQAQALCFLLLSASLYSALISGNAWLAYTWLALAVGCRPFVICFYPALFVYFAFRQHKEGKIKPLALLLPLIPSAMIGGAYMWYNWARFGDVLEFGHNYLPEFIESENGQFHPSYLGENFYRLFLRGVWLSEEGFLEYDQFDGFLFWFVNPFYIVFFAEWLRMLRRKTQGPVAVALMVCVCLQLIALMLHKTLGGWQFGARYTIEGMPYLAIPLLLGDRRDIPRWQVGVGLFGIAFNLYGAVAYLTLF